MVDNVKLRHIVLMYLGAAGGRIRKGNLQSVIYSLQYPLWRIGTRLDFSHRLFGNPHSYDIAQAADDLIGAGFAECNRISGVWYIDITESGSELANILSSRYGEIYGCMEEVASGRRS